MAFEHYIRSDGKNLRMGYTTGTCAALAAAGAVEGLLTGHIPERLSLITPKGLEVTVAPACCEVEALGCDREASGCEAEEFSCEREASGSEVESISDKTERIGDAGAKAVAAGAMRTAAARTDAVTEGAMRTTAVRTDAARMATGVDSAALTCLRMKRALCGVVKDAGDDKDATNGLLILAQAEFGDSRLAPEKNVQADFSGVGDARSYNDKSFDDVDRVRIVGGKGIGRVTKPGLDQKVGDAAINRVPREMIRKEVLRVCEEQGYEGAVTITIMAPEGEKAAKKTLNERMGIVGGISIIGTSGIVEPMSMKAYADSVRLQIRQTAACRRPAQDIESRPAQDNGSSFVLNHDNGLVHGGLILTPGNYGLNYLRQQGYDLMDVPVVVCSNYIGDALDEAAADGFDQILLVGHVGKLVKLAAGIMNTHSSMADGRLEIITAHAALAGAGTETCRRLMDCVTTDACIAILMECAIREKVIRSILTKAQMYLEKRCVDGRCGMIMFSNEYGELGRTKEADEILREWQKPMRP